LNKLDLPLVFKEQKALQHHYLYSLRGYPSGSRQDFRQPFLSTLEVRIKSSD
jgi:hypothetical protein